MLAYICNTYLFSKDFSSIASFSYYWKIRVPHHHLVKVIQAHPNGFEKHKKKGEKEIPAAAPPKVNYNGYFWIFSYAVLSSFKYLTSMFSVGEFPSSSIQRFCFYFYRAVVMPLFSLLSFSLCYSKEIEGDKMWNELLVSGRAKGPYRLIITFLVSFLKSTVKIYLLPCN